MAQSALTVTTPSPTPPTNMSFTGATPPNPPNYTKNTYSDPKHWSSVNPKDFPAPFFDDGTAGTLSLFAANTAALASGTTAGNTAGGTGVDGTTGNYGWLGIAVPASTSVAHEGAGTELVTTISVNNPNAPLITVGTGPVATQATRDAGPNGNHPSYLSGTTVPTITGAPSPNNTASGSGTVTMTLTGTGYTRASVVYIDGVAQTTNYVSATSLTVTNAPKRATAGTRSVTVVNGVGGPTSAASTWTFT